MMEVLGGMDFGDKLSKNGPAYPGPAPGARSDTVCAGRALRHQHGLYFSRGKRHRYPFSGGISEYRRGTGGHTGLLSGGHALCLQRILTGWHRQKAPPVQRLLLTGGGATHRRSSGGAVGKTQPLLTKVRGKTCLWGLLGVPNFGIKIFHFFLDTAPCLGYNTTNFKALNR